VLTSVADQLKASQRGALHAIFSNALDAGTAPPDLEAPMEAARAALAPRWPEAVVHRAEEVMNDLYECAAHCAMV
jgi:hypothetical protein